MELFAILCTTCQAKLKVRDVAALGKILACPKCGSMVQVVAPPGWKPPDPATLREIAAEPSTGSTIVDVRKFQLPGDAAPTGSTARLSAAIANERAQVQGAESRVGSTQPAPPPVSKAPSTIVRSADPTKSVTPPSAGARLQTSLSAPPVAVEATPINPDDVPPIPSNDPQPGILTRVTGQLAQRRALFVATPLAAVAVMLLGWFLFAPGADDGPTSAVLQPTANVPTELTTTSDTTMATSPDQAAPSDQLVPNTAPAESAAPAVADANAPAPDPVRHDAQPGEPADPMPDVAAIEATAQGTDDADTAPTAPTEQTATAPLAEDAASATPADGPEQGQKIIAAPAANLNRPVPAFGAVPAAEALPTAETAAATVEQENPRATAAPGDALLGQESMPHIDVTGRLADPLLEVDFKRVSLAEFCDFLSRLSTVPITLDVDALAASGIHPGDTVAVTAANTTVGDALTMVLAKRGLMYLVEGQQVIVTSQDRKAATLASVRYDVSDLAPAADDVAHLASLVTRFVAPTSWQDHGGQGQLKIDAGSLSVDQSAIVQRQVAAFLDKLRQARGMTAKSELRPEEVTLKTRYTRAKANLDKSITANFSLETPLIDVLTWLSRTAATRILIDEASLAQAGIWSRSPATVVVDHKPLHESLTALLAPAGMTYRIVDERTIQVFARQSLNDRYEFEVYPVTDLLAGRLEPAELISRLREQFDPATWTEGGGHGAIEYDATGKCLLVVQTPESQVRLENLLLRARPGSRAAP